jgi:hypothetical protein
MPCRPPSRPRSALLAGLLAGLGVPVLALVGPARAAMPQAASPSILPPGAVAQATPAPSAPVLQALESALNARDDAALVALLKPGPGLDPVQLRQRRQILRQQFPDASWRVRAGTPLHDGRGTVTLQVSGTRVQGGSTYRLDAQQTLVLQSDGRHLTGQTLLTESSLLRSGEKALPVVLQIPDAVLTGQRYDVDLIVDDPLDGALVAGGIAAVTPQQVAAMESPPLELGALGGGGVFKTVRAPQTPGSQTWAVLLVHPQGVVSATKRVRVVADRRALDP